MNKRHVFYVGLVLLAALVLFGAPMAAMAIHPNVTTLQASGAQVTLGTQAYSPKQTCGGCHFDCTTGAITTDSTKFCQTDEAKRVWLGALTTYNTTTNCNTAGKCPDYQSAATAIIWKTQSFQTSTGAFSAMTYSVTIPLGGAATGKHSTHGRNEELTADQKTIWGVPSTASGTGMWGRY